MILRARASDAAVFLRRHIIVLIWLVQLVSLRYLMRDVSVVHIDMWESVVRTTVKLGISVAITRELMSLIGGLFPYWRADILCDRLLNRALYILAGVNVCAVLILLAALYKVALIIFGTSLLTMIVYVQHGFDARL